MTTVELPIFGEINLQPLEEVYEAEAQLPSGTAAVWLQFFDRASAELADWAVVRSFLATLPDHAETARRSIIKGAHRDMLHHFREHHVEYGLLDADKDVQEMVADLNLKVAISPLESGHDFATFDFFVDLMKSDELLVVRMAPGGATASLSWES